MNKMSKLDWRNNKIHNLIGDPKDREIQPTYTQYLTWSPISKRSITAVGADYQNKMINELEGTWDGSALPVFGPDLSIPDDINSMVFQRAMVALAAKC